MGNGESKDFKPPYPWLLLREGHDCRSQPIFFNTSMLRKTHSRVLPCGCHGWLFIKDYPSVCFLWNAFTLESIPLPLLNLHDPDREVHSCILSSPPGVAESLIILFGDDGLLLFCRVGEQHWTEQRVTVLCDDGDHHPVTFLSNPVCFNGKVYVIGNINGTTARELLVILIDLNRNENLPAIRLHLSLPRDTSYSYSCQRYMVESCGEIFIICLLCHEVVVFKLDFPIMEWTQVESFKDRVFLLDGYTAYSYKAVNPETEGNRIYIARSDGSICAFNIEENSIWVSLPCPDLKTSFWLISRKVHRRFEHNLDDRKMDISTEHTKDIVPYLQGDDEQAKETCYLSKLPLDILSSIASSLMIHDYINFRLVNRACRLVAPPIGIKELARNSLPPLLMFCKVGKDECKFTDPLRQVSYLMNSPGTSNDVRMCCSKQGWCLMAHNNEIFKIFLWNPFTKETIPLPNPSHPNYTIVGCEILFSSDSFLFSSESSDCVISLIYASGCISFDYINLKQGNCDHRFLVEGIHESKLSTTNNNPVFYHGDLCLLDPQGTLTVFMQDDFTLEIECPLYSFHESFLLEANGKLLAVFMSFMGKWLKVFELDPITGVWVEVDCVGDQTIYISVISSFAATARTEELKNTICFPRFCGNNLVYYSLRSRKFHCYGSNAVKEDLYNTKEQLCSGWIEPRWELIADK